MSNYPSLEDNLICRADKSSKISTSGLDIIQNFWIPPAPWCHLDVAKMTSSDLVISPSSGKSPSTFGNIKPHAEKIIYSIFYAAIETRGVIAGCSTLVPILVVKSFPTVRTEEKPYLHNGNLLVQGFCKVDSAIA